MSISITSSMNRAFARAATACWSAMEYIEELSLVQLPSRDSSGKAAEAIGKDCTTRDNLRQPRLLPEIFIKDLLIMSESEEAKSATRAERQG